MKAWQSRRQNHNNTCFGRARLRGAFEFIGLVRAGLAVESRPTARIMNGKIQSFNCYPSGTVIFAQLGVLSNIEAAIAASSTTRT